MIFSESFLSPLGQISVFSDGNDITEVRFGCCESEHGDEITEEAVRQLREYFEGERTEFSLPLSPKGTPFQKRVWSALTEVEYGTVRTYKDIAQAIGSPGACRAVGGANGKNPIVIIIPCHRIVASGGKPGGYSAGLDKKLYLLELENKYAKKGRYPQ